MKHDALKYKSFMIEQARTWKQLFYFTFLLNHFGSATEQRKIHYLSLLITL